MASREKRTTFFRILFSKCVPPRSTIDMELMICSQTSSTTHWHPTQGLSYGSGGISDFELILKMATGGKPCVRNFQELPDRRFVNELTPVQVCTVHCAGVQVCRCAMCRCTPPGWVEPPTHDRVDRQRLLAQSKCTWYIVRGIHNNLLNTQSEVTGVNRVVVFFPGI